MISLYSSQETEQMKKRAGISLFVALAFLCGGLILCVSLCARVNTGNAHAMFLRVVTAFTLAGWCAILLLRLQYFPARAEYRHALYLNAGEAEECRGVLSVSRQRFRIPRSVTVRRIVLRQGEEEIHLSVNARLAHRLPPDGTCVRVRQTQQFVTAWEACDE